MTTGAAAPSPILQFWLNNGQLAAGGSVLTQVGGSNAATYQDVGLTTPLPNPIPLNSRGEVSNASGASCQLFLPQNTVYTFTLFDANGNQIWQATYVNGILATLTQTAVGAALYPPTPQEIAFGSTIASIFYPPGNVLRYGADPTGQADSTAAFNQATFATSAYVTLPLTQPNQLQDIYVPPGTYNLLGTVYVRKGQRLHGAFSGTYIVANNSGTTPTFQMGWGNLTVGGPTVDPGGQPVSISDLFILGGPSSGTNDGTVVFNGIAGGFIDNLFLSGPGIGLGFYGSGDIEVSNVLIEIAQIGIAFNVNGNVHLTNVEFFNCHFDVSFSGVCTDIQFTGFHSEFNQTDSILLSTGSTVFGLQIDNAKWIYNVQYGVVGTTPSPNPTILNQSTNSDIQISNFRVNNSPGYFYANGTGTGCVSRFSNGVIDGQRSFNSYAQSTTALGFSIANERVTLNNVTQKNLPGNGIPCVLAGNATPTILELRDCEWYSNNASFSLLNITSGLTTSIFRAFDCIGDKLQVLCNAQATVPMVIRRCTDWFGAIGTSGAAHFVTFPYQFSNVWQISVSMNQASGGSANYRKATVINLEKDNDFSGTAKSFLTANVLVQGAANLNGLLNITPEFTAVGGGNNIASSNAGVICVSWPLANVSNETVDVQQIL